LSMTLPGLMCFVADLTASMMERTVCSSALAARLTMVTAKFALELERQIYRYFKLHGQFSNCLNRFSRALAESRLPVPAGQSSHVLRHTFASRSVINGGSILTLQKILGHTTLAMTMRYTHLAPDHLRDAVKLGPAGDCHHFPTIIARQLTSC